jgi:hypothetical protein
MLLLSLGAYTRSDEYQAADAAQVSAGVANPVPTQKKLLQNKVPDQVPARQTIPNENKARLLRDVAQCAEDGLDPSKLEAFPGGVHSLLEEEDLPVFHAANNTCHHQTSLAINLGQPSPLADTGIVLLTDGGLDRYLHALQETNGPILIMASSSQRSIGAGIGADDTHWTVNGTVL